MKKLIRWLKEESWGELWAPILIALFLTPGGWVFLLILAFWIIFKYIL